MFTMKVDGIGILCMKHVERIDRSVLIAKKPKDTLALLIGNALEAMLRLVLVFFDQCLVHIEFLHTIQTGILELLRSRHTMSFHRFAHFHSGIDTDTVETIELFCIHASHRSTNNECRFLFLTDLL